MPVPAGERNCSEACSPPAVRLPAPALRPMFASPVAQSWSAEMPPTGEPSAQERLSHERPAASHAYTV
jgi:hypothetical protein